MGPCIGFNVPCMSGADERVTSRRGARPGAALVWLVVVLGACGTSAGTATTTRVIVPETVAIGELPEPLTGVTPPPTPPTTAPPSTAPATVPPDERLEGPVGEQVLGNRIIVIGDSLFAGTAPRNDGIMCDVLTSFGWDVELDAEPGRFVEFGGVVLDQRLRPDGGDDWDAAAIFVGNQFDGDVESFTRELDEALTRLAPRPTLIYTLTETDTDRAALNEVIRDRPRFHPNLKVIEWAEITSADDADLLLVDNGPLLTDEGSGRLVLYTAEALGRAPGDTEGDCLPSVFTDDSAIVL